MSLNFSLLWSESKIMPASEPVCCEEEDDEESVENEDWNLPLAFNKKRHLETIERANSLIQIWRMKERMKTVSVALVICLNVGVDPPDITKTTPCARLECWIDPLTMGPQKALEAIGSNLQKQYERWQPRARYKQSLDPTMEEVKKLCTSLRRNAKEERVLFHYNGHGVPKPTTNGEIWVFNRMYTQYIPLSIYDLQTWMGAPSIYVYDCSNAGVIVDLFEPLAEQHERDYEMNPQSKKNSTPPPNYKNCIQLAACSANEILPMNPDLPADLFTSCLTTPIKIALRWFAMQNNNPLVPQVGLDAIDKIPGQLNDRRTMLGELNWIFTAITDTIAWNTLPRDLFQRLFRQDLLVASLFRNFLLAERIMRSYDCTPVSSPRLPPTFHHPMWEAWDLALDLCLSQLPQVLESEDNYVHSPFFEEQLTAFEVWLTFGSESRSPPEQLPIVLQVLLSQVHRLRALELLGKFLDLGPWAVNLALSVGIFPYVLRLLQSSAKELRPLLVFIWAKILAVDPTCQTDLVRENGHKYFIAVLQDTAMPSEERTRAAFVLACIVDDFTIGQEVAQQASLVSICLEQLNDPCPHLRQWLSITLGRLWKNYDKARWCGVRDSAHEKLYALLKDPVPEVRAAGVFALGTFINSVTERSEHANNIDHSVAMTLLNVVSRDMSPLVRKELVAAVQNIIFAFENSFLSVAMQELKEGAKLVLNKGSLKGNLAKDRSRYPSFNNYYNTITSGISTSAHLDVVDGSFEKIKRVASSSSLASLATASTTEMKFVSVYQKLWAGLTALDADPFPGVANMSRAVTEHIRDQIKETHSPREVTEAKASSLPPSPSNHNYLNNETLPASRTPKFIRTPQIPRAKKPSNTVVINEDFPLESYDSAKAIVSTQYVEWSSKYFAQPSKMDNECDDNESLTYYQRQWRYKRNAELRKEAKEEQMRVGHSKLDTQLFFARCNFSPTSVKLHPYEPHVAAAYKENFSVWDYQNSTKVITVRGERSAKHRVTCLEYINAHDVSLVATGSEDGAIRVWRSSGSLLTSWQAVTVQQYSIHSLKQRHSYGTGTVAGVGVMGWDQKRLQFIAGGDSRYLRMWDAETELALPDIMTGADVPVTCLSIDPSGGSTLCVGCADGTVRLFDRRLSSHDCRVLTCREHSARIVSVALSSDGNASILAGSAAGDVKVIDTRMHSSAVTCQAGHGQGLEAMAVHSQAAIYACASVNQISMYQWSGTPLGCIKSYVREWFPSSTKLGSVGCLSFHPHRVLLAVGSEDSVAVYTLEPKR